MKLRSYSSRISIGQNKWTWSVSDSHGLWTEDRWRQHIWPLIFFTPRGTNQQSEQMCATRSHSRFLWLPPYNKWNLFFFFIYNQAKEHYLGDHFKGDGLNVPWSLELMRHNVCSIPCHKQPQLSSDTSVFIAEFPKTSFTLGLLLQRFLGRSRK